MKESRKCMKCTRNQDKGEEKLQNSKRKKEKQNLKKTGEKIANKLIEQRSSAPSKANQLFIEKVFKKQETLTQWKKQK